MLNLPLAAGGGGGGGGVTSVSAGTGVSVTGSAAAPIVNVDAATAFAWTAAQGWTISDAGTTTVVAPITLAHRNSAAGTPAAAYGVGLVFQLDSSLRTLRSAGEVNVVWSTATDGAEVSSVVFKTMLAGTLTEVVRFGTGASLPDSDFSVSIGRCLIDSRASDIAYFSHRDMTSTVQYAIRQTAAGATIVNCQSGQTASLAHAGTIRVQANTTGIGFFAATPVAQQVSAANLTNNVTSGGTDNTIDNVVADGTVATAADLVTTRNAVYQLARKLKQVNDGLRAFALFT